MEENKVKTFENPEELVKIIKNLNEAEKLAVLDILNGVRILTAKENA